jgi:hypothetical protein
MCVTIVHATYIDTIEINYSQHNFTYIYFVNSNFYFNLE